LEIRLDGADVRSLYGSGSSPTLDERTVIAFFSALEAIEASSSVAELRAVRSLRVSTRGRTHRVRLTDRFVLVTEDRDGAGETPEMHILLIEAVA
jgi:hypothetical protein